MLPGFRFFFAAIVLSMSLLVFGLGAAAVLRAAHEEFAASGSWHPAPEALAGAQQNDTTVPVIAMLGVEPPTPEPKPADAPADAVPATPAANALPQSGSE